MGLARYDGFVSLDWGFNCKLSCHWWDCLPDGRYYLCREWVEAGVYVEDFAARFWTITREEVGWDRPRYVVVGGDTKNRSGIRSPTGESVQETLRHYGLPVRDADRDRKNGWYRVHELLRPSPFGTPWLMVDPTCRYLIRTIAAAPSDPADPDEIDPKYTEDHALEDVRYGAMSRPSPSRIVVSEPFPEGSWGWHKATYHPPEPEGVLS